jgi:hypothetical protein
MPFGVREAALNAVVLKCQAFIGVDNAMHPHQALKYRTPAEVYGAATKATANATDLLRPDRRAQQFAAGP